METSARYFWVGLFTLAVILAGLGSIYWLHHSGGLAKRAIYQIRFEGPVSSLQTGAAVQFNGIRVGEVTNLGFDLQDPTKVVATIGIGSGIPIKADTHVDINVPGLTGSPEISLRGGTLSAPTLQGSDTNPPVLAASADAGQDVMASARSALQRLNKILNDNSSRINGILAGLEHFVGGGDKERQKPIYDITLVTVSKPFSPPKAQFIISDPTANVVLQTQRLLMRSNEGQITQLGEAQWSDTLPKLLQEKIIQSFENAGFLASVLPPVDQATVNYRLLIDLRSFSILSNSNPDADVEYSVKIMAEDGRIISAKIFHATVSAKDMEVPSLVAAFDQAFGQTATELIAWTAKIIAS